MKLYAKTDVGRKREINQDYVYVTDKPIGPFPNLLVVADGMGGHKAGDFASKYTVKVLREELESTSLDKPEEILRNVVTKANHELIRAAHTDVKLEGMGTTLVAGTVIGNTLYFANVGDSRLLNPVCCGCPDLPRLPLMIQSPSRGQRYPLRILPHSAA